MVPAAASAIEQCSSAESRFFAASERTRFTDVRAIASRDKPATTSSVLALGIELRTTTKPKRKQRESNFHETEA